MNRKQEDSVVVQEMYSSPKPTVSSVLEGGFYSCHSTCLPISDPSLLYSVQLLDLRKGTVLLN